MFAFYNLMVFIEPLTSFFKLLSNSFNLFFKFFNLLKNLGLPILIFLTDLLNMRFYRLDISSNARFNREQILFCNLILCYDSAIGFNLRNQLL